MYVRILLDYIHFSRFSISHSSVYCRLSHSGHTHYTTIRISYELGAVQRGAGTSLLLGVWTIRSSPRHRSVHESAAHRIHTASTPHSHRIRTTPERALHTHSHTLTTHTLHLDRKWQNRSQFSRLTLKKW